MASGKSEKRLLLSTACLFVSCAIFASASIAAENVGLWQVYETALKSAKYVDLTHIIPPVLASSNPLSTLHQRFACARLSQPCLPESCPDVSATFTTVAFDDSIAAA
jgi:hypothetical protein